MKRIIAAVLIACGVLAGIALPATAANVNNFSIAEYQIKMDLRKDDANHSLLRTTETIVANFPEVEQNRGIERAIPKIYDGHGVNLTIESVTRTDGTAWNYTTYDDDNDNLVVRIGDADKYVLGSQTYVITYTQRDVTKYFQDNNRQEFYWDTNGTEWLVPIDQLAVELVIDESLMASRTGDPACYIGAQGSTTRCELQEQGQTLATTATNLPPNQNITLSVGFEPGTFAEYEPTLLEKLFGYWAWVQAATIPIAIAIGGWVMVRFSRAYNRNHELGTIAPEYIPPRGTSVTTAAKIAKRVHGSVMAAQLVDLAVRHYIAIQEVEQKQLFGKKRLYHIEILKPLDGLLPEELELLEDMFGTSRPTVGDTLDLKTLQNNSAYYSRTTDNDSKLKDNLLNTYELREVDAKLKNTLRRVGLGSLAVGAITVGPALILLGVVAFAMSLQPLRLTDKGLALRRYLEGLKYYITVAESERINMLLGPDSAQKIAELDIDARDNRQRVVLYERLLPYAILFGQEKNWTKQLGAYYAETNQQPSWYRGSGAFDAATFGSAMSTFTSSTAMYGSASNSSSSGSSGGGSSGGGGGGGGGGGW